jgi:predicted kinase
VESPRPLDRLDRRIASKRLRARHVRAVARALAERHAPPAPRYAPRELSCHSVFVSKHRRVCFLEPRVRVTTSEVAGLVEAVRSAGEKRRAEQLAASYARIADDYGLYRQLTRLSGEPLLIATGGGVASGKSTFAKAVARLLAAPRIVGDRVRRLLLEQESGVHELAGSDEIGELIYAGLLSRASSALSAGRSVVLDACFPRASRRAAAAELAAKHAARFLFVHCHAPVADIIARLRLRDVRDGVAPGSWEALAASVEAQWEPPAATEPGRRLHVDTSQPRAHWLNALGLTKPEFS